ncbi:MAG: gluconokinase [Dehalococcoidia bacterium]
MSGSGPPGSGDYESPFILVIDIGSSSIKGGLYDARARAVKGTSAREPNEQTVASDGTSEQSAKEIQEAVGRVVDSVLAQSGKFKDQIAAVGADSMASTILGVDQEGRPVTPVYTYADSRSAADVEALRRELDVRAVYDRTGCPQHTSYVPGRIRWLQRTDPDTAAKVYRWVDLPTYIYSGWFARQDVPASYSVASWSGMLNRRKLAWDRGLLGHLGVEKDMLPPLASHDDPVSGLSSEFAGRWPDLADKPFFLAVGDGAAVNVGTGCVTPGRIALTVGTTGALRLLLHGQTPDVPRGLWAYCLGTDSTLLGGSFSEGGNILEWTQETLRLPPADKVEDELKKLKPDGHGISVLPFIAGERSIGWSTAASGTFRGIRISTRPIDILQACMEAVAYRFALVAGLLLPLAGKDPVIVASGGGIHGSDYWLQTIADVMQSQIGISGESQETSRGSAILALHALGVWPELDAHTTDIVRIYDPRPDLREVYGEALDRQRELYRAILGEPGF